MNISGNTMAIIPCYNCSKTVGDVVYRSKKYIDEILVVDDCSTDLSRSVAEKAGATVIVNEQNMGVGGALKLGFKYAKHSNSTNIIMLDADGAHVPEDIPGLLDAHVNSKNVLTIGNRWADTSQNTPSTKIAANKFAITLVNTLLNAFVPDVASGFRVINADLIPLLIPCSNSFGFLYEMIFIASRFGTIGHHEIKVIYDANQLWVTKRLELINLLDVFLAYADDLQIHSKATRIRDAVNEWKVFSVYTMTSTKELIYAHPLSECGGYVFQVQHPLLFKEIPFNCIKI